MLDNIKDADNRNKTYNFFIICHNSGSSWHISTGAMPYVIIIVLDVNIGSNVFNVNIIKAADKISVNKIELPFEK